MPRTSRKKSASGFYHIVMRGIGQQYIFEDDEDRIRFIETLQRYKTEMGFEIYAYCIMGNHIHLLIKDVKNQLETIMKKIAGSYAYYFNWKYQRVGHLFQDRYKSEAIEDDRYFLAVLRYIHQNPQRAGIIQTTQYRWSSHNEYINDVVFINTSFALKLLGGKEAYLAFINHDEQGNCLELNHQRRITDEEAIDIITEISGLRIPQQIQDLAKGERTRVLLALKSKGLSERQISRLTGVSKGVIYRAK